MTMAEHRITLTERQERGREYGVARGSSLQNLCASACDAWAEEADRAKLQRVSTLAARIEQGRTITKDEKADLQRLLDAAPVADEPTAEAKG
jgi:hypothetical protein